MTRALLSDVRPRGSGGAAGFIYPLVKGTVGTLLEAGFVVTEAVVLGDAGDGESWLQPTAITVPAGAAVNIPVVLRPGAAGLVPSGTLEGVALTGYAPMTVPGEALEGVPDWTAVGTLAGSAAGARQVVFQDVEGGRYLLVVNDTTAPNVASVVVNNAPAGGHTAWKPGDTLSLTVTTSDSVQMDAVYIGGALAQVLDEPSTTATFDWVLPATGVVGLDPAVSFTVVARFRDLPGTGLAFTVAEQVPVLVGLTNRAEDYPGDQVALKGSESVVMTGRIETPNTGSYSFAAVAPAGMSVSAQTYTPVDGTHTDYSVTLQRSTAAEGQPALQFTVTGTASGASVTAGSHPLDIQLTAPTISFHTSRVKFGTGTNTVVLRSNKRLMTRPVMDYFTATTETAAGTNWDYSYTRTNVAAPESGENVGISTSNAPSVTTDPVGGSGITGASVTGTYTLYGWFGSFDFTFSTPYVKKASLSSLQQQALVDPGTVTAVSNATDAPTWRTENDAGAATDVPAATKIALTNADVLNASGTATLSLTSG